MSRIIKVNNGVKNTLGVRSKTEQLENNRRKRREDIKYKASSEVRRAIGRARQAFPSCLKNNQEVLRELFKIYFLCEKKNLELDNSYQVSCIIPLNGKLVSGLMVPANLNVLSDAIQNTFEKDNFDDEYYEDICLTFLLEAKEREHRKEHFDKIEKQRKENNKKQRLDMKKRKTVNKSRKDYESLEMFLHLTEGL